MKYLDRVVIVENCTYHFDNSTFSSLDAAIEYIQKIPFKTRLEAYGRTVTITIRNPYAPAIFNKALIPDHLMIKDCKDPLCIYAKERELTLAADLSEVYTEHFELYESADFGFEHIFDYGVLYGNYPVYTGRELCLSRISPDGEDRNLAFVPEPTGIYGVDRPHTIYKCRALYIWLMTVISFECRAPATSTMMTTVPFPLPQSRYQPLLTSDLQALTFSAGPG